MRIFKFILIACSFIIAEQNSKTYYDIQGNEIIYVDQEWKYIVFPNNDHDHTVIPGLGHTSNTFSSNIFKEYLNSIF